MLHQKHMVHDICKKYYATYAIQVFPYISELKKICMFTWKLSFVSN